MDWPTILTGTGAATVLLAYIVKKLWESHEKTDADVIAQRDRALTGWESQQKVTERIADALEEQNRDRAARRRSTDSA